MPDICRVIRNYKASTSDPLIVNKGDELTVGNKTSEWAGWLWCSLSSAKSGWVPENFVKRIGHNCIMLRDYDATELTAKIGAQLTVLEKESGWAWCTNHQGLKGWLPLAHLE